jgi:hypothetical protein
VNEMPECSNCQFFNCYEDGENDYPSYPGLSGRTWTVRECKYNFSRRKFRPDGGFTDCKRFKQRKLLKINYMDFQCFNCGDTWRVTEGMEVLNLCPICQSLNFKRTI